MFRLLFVELIPVAFFICIRCKGHVGSLPFEDIIEKRNPFFKQDTSDSMFYNTFIVVDLKDRENILNCEVS